MTPEQIADISNLTIKTLLYVSFPLMLVALIVGLIIALFQALTSIQEMTLTFVPKILLVFLSLMILLPWMSDKMMLFATEIFSLIAGGGSGVA